MCLPERAHGSAARERGLGLLAAALAFSVAASGVAVSFEARQQASRTIWDGVYSDAQARRGQKVYTEICVYCHGPDFEGDEMGPALRGSSFIAQWSGQPVLKLFTKIVETMPQDDPGTLTPQNAVDVMTYLLEANQVPAGKSDLPGDTAALERIAFTNRPAR
jgi:S-disulfanyl-L-cysteine oxidoreductase SoxD